MQPIQPQPGRLPQPTPCADPCIRTMQNQQAEQGNALEGLGELLQSLLDGQQEQEQQNELSVIQVPVCSCNLDGTATIQQIELTVPKNQEVTTFQQFSTLAAIQVEQCKIQRHTERAHNILGGEAWFASANSRTPAFKTRVERKIKEAGTLFGFPAVAPETGEPSTVGQVTAGSLIDLINAYTSNLYHRAGFQGLPTQVPKTLLGYTDADPPEAINDLANYFAWYVRQFDALVGKFPINITIEDVDPLTQGDQVKQIELPNISEALAEMFGMNISTSVNADVSVNFLMRLAAELVATKNSSLITQDYVRANAAFLGYKGNPVKREINYAFDPTKLDTLDAFLNDSKASIVGWEEDDKESVVGFLQRIVFSAGIIKSVFFKDKNRLAELQKEIENMMKGDKAITDADWEAFLLLINNPEEYFNKDSIPRPRVKEKPAPPPPEEQTP